MVVLGYFFISDLKEQVKVTGYNIINCWKIKLDSDNKCRLEYSRFKIGNKLPKLVLIFIYTGCKKENYYLCCQIKALRLITKVKEETAVLKPAAGVKEKRL